MSTISPPLTYNEYVRRHRAELTNNAKDELLSESEFNNFGRLEKLYLAKQRPDWDYVQSTWVDYPDANDNEYSDKPLPVFVSSNPFGRKIGKIDGRGGNRRRTRNGKSSTKRRTRNMRRKYISRRHR
jgi:hypothetical protein